MTAHKGTGPVGSGTAITKENAANVHHVAADPLSVNQETVDQVIVDMAAKLSLVEVGLGALVHGFKIPFGGHLLSLNQGFFLSRLVKKTKNVEGAKSFPIYVSSISALLKSLSPAGDKLGPMLSISVQGTLFSLPLLLLGPHLIAVLLGMVLLSVWAFLQPFFTLYLFFGNSLFQAGQFYLDKMQKTFGVGPDTVLKVVAIAMVLKALAGVALGWIAFIATEERLVFWDERILRYSQKWSRSPQNSSGAGGAKRQSALSLVVKDLTRPFFLFSMFLMIAFFYFSEGDVAKTGWLSLRPLAIAVLFFYVSRSSYLHRWAESLSQNPAFPRFGRLFYSTLQKISPRKTEGRKSSTLAVLLLAAGSSKRMGEMNKLLLPMDGQPLVRRTAEEFLKYPFHEVVVVTGFEEKQIAMALDGLPVRLVHNPHHHVGMHGSIRAGLLALQKEIDGFVISLSDQPLLHVGIIERLVREFSRQDGPRIVFPTLAGQRGHPVIISKDFIPEILAEADGDYGCHYLFKRHPGQLHPVALEDSGTTVDVDTPEQYEEVIFKAANKTRNLKDR